MKCFYPRCQSAPWTNGKGLWRINATGNDGVWACDDHRRNTDAPKDDQVEEIVAILSGERSVPARRRGRESVSDDEISSAALVAALRRGLPLYGRNSSDIAAARIEELEAENAEMRRLLERAFLLVKHVVHDRTTDLSGDPSAEYLKHRLDRATTVRDEIRAFLSKEQPK